MLIGLFCPHKVFLKTEGNAISAEFTHLWQNLFLWEEQARIVTTSQWGKKQFGWLMCVVQLECEWVGKLMIFPGSFNSSLILEKELCFLSLEY